MRSPVTLVTQTQEREDLCGNLFTCRKFIEWYNHVSSHAAKTEDEQATEDEINKLLGKADDIPNASVGSLLKS